jgi:hypothetical protein
VAQAFQGTGRKTRGHTSTADGGGRLRRGEEQTDQQYKRGGANYEHHA